MFPKSSGPPPTLPPTSTAMYIRQRVEHEVTQRLTAAPLPPPPPPPEPALITRSDGNVSLAIHDASMAERCLQIMTERVAQAVMRDGSRTPRRPHVISAPPALPVLQDGSPPGTWELPWSCLQVPNMNTVWYRVHSDYPDPCGLDLAHRFMPEAFTLPSISGLEVHDFPWKDPKQEHWYVLEQILMQIRPKLMRDSYRLRTAAEAWGNFLPHADFDFPPDDSAVNKWFAALVQAANRQSQMSVVLSQEASCQIWHLAKALAAAKNVSRLSASSSEICYWLIRDGAVKGIVLILRRSYPSQNQAVFVAPFAHNTNAHDMASILTEAKIRPSWTSNDDLPSMGFYARLKFPVANMRVPSNDREGRLALEESLLAARKFGGYNSSRPVCAFGWVYCRQSSHRKVAGGGMQIDRVTSHFADVTHGADNRWLIRSSQAILSGVASFW